MIAYLILAHADPASLRQLIEVLQSDERSRVYLHFDRKAELPDWCAEFPSGQAPVLVPRLAVNWAGYSMVRAMSNLMYAALEDPQVNMLVFLSGSSFPLRPMKEINDTLSRRDTGSFALWKTVHGRGARATRRERNAVDKFHFMDVAALNPWRGKLRRQLWKLARGINSLLPYARSKPGLIVKGSQWFHATRSEAEILLDERDGLSKRLRRSFAPDEMLFQTRWYRHQLALGRTPRFEDEDAPLQALHYIPQHPPRGSLLQQMRTDIDPRLLKQTDIEPALRSGALFARKCPPDVVDALLPLFSTKTAHPRSG